MSAGKNEALRLSAAITTAPPPKLSEKEKLILKRLAAGVPAKLICRELKLSAYSLYTYSSRARKKLAVKTTEAAIAKLAELEARAAARLVEAASEGALNP